MFYALLLTFDFTAKKQVILSLLIGIFYSITDEVHQFFIPDRSGQVIDVFIDSIGVMLGICVLLLIVKIFNICHKQVIENK